MNLLFFTVNIIGICFEAAITNIVYTTLSKRKYFNKIYMFLFYLTFIALRSVAFFYAKDVFSNVIVTLVAMTLLSLLYKFSRIKQVISILVLCITGILLEYATGFLLSFILNITVGEIINSAIFYTVGLLVSKLIMFGGVKFFSSKYKPKNDLVVNKVLILFIIFPVITFFVGVVFIGGLGLNLNDNMTIIGSIAMALLVGANVLVFYLFEQHTKQMQEENRIVLINEQLRLEKQYLERLTHAQKASDRAEHDLKNQLFAIASLLQKDEVKAKQELINVCEEMNAKQKMIYLDNIAIDCLINSKFEIMNNSGIDFSSEVFISNLGNFDDLDTCIVLGNLLDNAIDACRLNTIKEHKKITLSIKEDDSYIKILIRNRVDKIVKIENNSVATRKEDKNKHGFGIENSKKIVQKYQGDLILECDDNWFTALIIIKI